MILSARAGIKTNIKSCFLYVKEVKLYEEDNITYLKMLNEGYNKTINFLVNHTRTFDGKMSEINKNFVLAM